MGGGITQVTVRKIAKTYGNSRPRGRKTKNHQPTSCDPVWRLHAGDAYIRRCWGPAWIWLWQPFFMTLSRITEDFHDSRISSTVWDRMWRGWLRDCQTALHGKILRCPHEHLHDLQRHGPVADQAWHRAQGRCRRRHGSAGRGFGAHLVQFGENVQQKGAFICNTTLWIPFEMRSIAGTRVFQVLVTFRKWTPLQSTGAIK